MNDEVEVVGRQYYIHGGKEINDVCNYLMDLMDLPFLDGSLKQNRQFAKHLINKSRKTFGDRWMEAIQVAITNASQDAFWHKNLTSIRPVYKNFARFLKLGQGTTTLKI